MGTDLVPTPGWNALTVPDPGEAVRAATLAGAVRPGYQGLLDRIGAILRGLKNAVRVECVTSPNIVIRSLGWVGLKDNTGVWTALFHAGPTTFDVAVSVGGLAANQRYYIYAYENAGVIAFVANNNAPDSELLYENANQELVFITTVVTDSTAAILPFTQSNREYCYTTRTGGGGGADGNLVLDGGNATIITSVSLGFSVPDFVSIVKVEHYLEANTTNGNSRLGNDLTDPAHSVCYANTNFEDSDQVDLAQSVGTLGAFEYFVDNSGNAVFVWIAGFTF